MQHFEATCVRNVLIVKNLEHGKFKEWYHVKEEKKSTLIQLVFLSYVCSLKKLQRHATFGK